MYIHWVKPYLRNIQRLQLDQSKTETPDLLVAFESSMIEVELLARRPGARGYNEIILLNYLSTNFYNKLTSKNNKALYQILKTQLAD